MLLVYAEPRVPIRIAVNAYAVELHEPEHHTEHDAKIFVRRFSGFYGVQFAHRDPGNVTHGQPFVEPHSAFHRYELRFRKVLYGFYDTFGTHAE